MDRSNRFYQIFGIQNVINVLLLLAASYLLGWHNGYRRSLGNIHKAQSEIEDVIGRAEQSLLQTEEKQEQIERTLKGCRDGNAIELPGLSATATTSDVGRHPRSGPR